MKTATLITALVLFVAIGSATVTQQTPNRPGGVVILKSAEVQWTDYAGRPGVKLAVIEGDMTKAGPFMIRVKFPANYALGPHTHPGVEHTTVLSGTLQIGYGTKEDGPAEKLPAARLLGASWLLSTGQRAAATAVLDELAKSSDARIAGLAQVQLWRTKLVTASPAEISRWLAQLEKMPPEIQAAGWYVLGDLFSRQNQPEQAALAYLKVPLLFRQQRALAADALLAAGKQLEKMGQPSQAAGLYRELVRDFAHLPAAREAQSRLDSLTTKP